jgi:hypothetical protein
MPSDSSIKQQDNIIVVPPNCGSMKQKNHANNYKNTSDESGLIYIMNMKKCNIQ